MADVAFWVRSGWAKTDRKDVLNGMSGRRRYPAVQDPLVMAAKK